MDSFVLYPSGLTVCEEEGSPLSVPLRNNPRKNSVWPSLGQLAGEGKVGAVTRRTEVEIIGPGTP